VIMTYKQRQTFRLHLTLDISGHTSLECIQRLHRMGSDLFDHADWRIEPLPSTGQIEYRNHVLDVFLQEANDAGLVDVDDHSHPEECPCPLCRTWKEDVEPVKAEPPPTIPQGPPTTDAEMTALWEIEQQLEDAWKAGLPKGLHGQLLASTADLIVEAAELGIDVDLALSELPKDGLEALSVPELHKVKMAIRYAIREHWQELTAVEAKSKTISNAEPEEILYLSGEGFVRRRLDGRICVYRGQVALTQPFGDHVIEIKRTNPDPEWLRKDAKNLNNLFLLGPTDQLPEIIPFAVSDNFLVGLNYPTELDEPVREMLVNDLQQLLTQAGETTTLKSAYSAVRRPEIAPISELRQSIETIRRLLSHHEAKRRIQKRKESKTPATVSPAGTKETENAQ